MRTIPGHRAFLAALSVTVVLVVNSETNALPFILVSANLVSESCSPPTTQPMFNSAIDPFENVTIRVCLLNSDNPPASNLLVTLLEDNHIRIPSGPQLYGFMPPGGPPVCRNFSFDAAQVCGGMVAARFHLQDGNSDLGILIYTFNLGRFSEGEYTCCYPACGLICPDDITVEAVQGQCSAAVEYPLPTKVFDPNVGDLCDGVSYGDRNGPMPSGTTFNVGSHLVFAQGGAGANCTFIVTVLDTQPPVVTCPDTEITALVGDDCKADVPDMNALITRSDNCPDGRTTAVTQDPPAGTRVAAGTTAITVTVTDNSGNTAQCTQNLRVAGRCGCDVCGTSMPVAMALAAPWLLSAKLRRRRMARSLRR